MLYREDWIRSVHKINHYLNVCTNYERKSKSVHKIDIHVNKSKVKYTKDEELVVMNIKSIKVPVYSKLFQWCK